MITVFVLHILFTNGSNLWHLDMSLAECQASQQRLMRDWSDGRKMKRYSCTPKLAKVGGTVMVGPFEMGVPYVSDKTS